MSITRSGTVVVDTNVVSFAHRGDDRYDFYDECTLGMTPVIALQTYEEIWYGARRDGWGWRRLDELIEFLKGYTIAFPDRRIATACGELRARQSLLGKTLSTEDAWIVATALTLDCPLATHDSRLAEVPDLKLIQAPEARA